MRYFALALVACTTPARQPVHATLPVEPAPVQPPPRDETALAYPELEVTTAAAITLPTVPSFELPVLPNGAHSVRELRVAGAKLLASEVTVTGVVTFAYDCVAQLREPGQKIADVKARIERDPTKCERAKFYIGDTAKTPVDRSLWIVDVPRPFSRAELKASPPSEPDRCDPRKKSACPVYRVGDVVTITGTFEIVSPHSERNSDGLLIYHHMINTTQNWQSPPTPKVSTNVPRVLDVAALAPEPSAPDDVEKSKAHLNAGNRALGEKQFDTAIAAYRQAVDAWRGNHLAWYGMGGAFSRLGKWDHASDAYANAVEAAPDAAMYQMWYGIALYERAVSAVREGEARRENKKPEEVKRIDLSAVNFEKAKLHLEKSVAIADGLWRAHYYLGRIERDGGHAKLAATQLTTAIARNPKASGPCIALVELYHRWDYFDEAIAVATECTKTIDEADVWFVLGTTLVDKLDEAKALDAFDKALAIDRNHEQARFARVQILFRKKDPRAKADLEILVRSSDTWISQNSMGMLRALEEGR